MLLNFSVKQKKSSSELVAVNDIDVELACKILVHKWGLKMHPCEIAVNAGGFACYAVRAEDFEKKEPSGNMYAIRVIAEISRYKDGISFTCQPMFWFADSTEWEWAQHLGCEDGYRLPAQQMWSTSAYREFMNRECDPRFIEAILYSMKNRVDAKELKKRIARELKEAMETFKTDAAGHFSIPSGHGKVYAGMHSAVVTLSITSGDTTKMQKILDVLNS